MKKLFEKIKQNFEFFAKKQGRPSKETLRKRKMFYVITIFIFILVIFSIANFTFLKINKNKVKGEVASTDTQTESRFVFKEDFYDSSTGDYYYILKAPDTIKYYKVNVYYKKKGETKYNNMHSLDNSDSDSNDFYFSPFSKDDDVYEYKITLQAFDDSNYSVVNKNIDTWKPKGWKTNTTDNTAYSEFVVDPAIKHEACINDEVKNGNINSAFTTTTLNVFQRIINMIFRILGKEPPYKETTIAESLGFMGMTNEVAPTDGVSRVEEAKDYTTIFKLKNTYNNNAYYKILKYNSLNMKPENLINGSEAGKCIAFKGDSTEVKTTFNLSSKNKEAVGVIKIFLSKELCEAELGDYTKSYSVVATKYKYIGETTTAATTITTTKKVEPKMVLDKITSLGSELSKSTVKRTFNGKEYDVHEIKNEQSINVHYKIGGKVSGTYSRKLYKYDNFEGGKLIDSSTCRAYDSFSGEAQDDFYIGLSQPQVRTEFVVYSGDNCSGYVVSNTKDYYLYTGHESESTNVDGNVKLTAYSLQETACISDMSKLENAIYNDSTFGNVRIIAANKLKEKYGCGTIVELKGDIQLENSTVSSAKAIVLDIGGAASLINGTSFDLMLNCSDSENWSLSCSGKQLYYSNPTVSYKVLRQGYNGPVSGTTTKTTTKTTSSNNIAISLKDKDGNVSNNNVVTVNQLGDYKVVAKITQSGTDTLYYRWDTYNGVNANEHVYTDIYDHGNYSYCSSFNSKEKTFDSLETIEFKDKNNPRSGKFSLYKSAADCKAGKNSVKSAVIGYNYGTTTTSNNGSSTVSIKLEDRNGNTADSNNIVSVSSTGSYYAKATITQSGTNTLYYRWDTFNGLNAASWAYSDPSNYCLSFNSKTKTVSDLESLDFYNISNPRSGRLSVYSNKTDCTNDSKATGSKAIATKTISYKYNSSSTNNTEYKFLNNFINGNATLANLTSKIGSQAPSVCYDFALAYGVFIIKNGQGNFNNAKCGDSGSYPAGPQGGAAYGASSSQGYENSVSGYKLMYNKIKATIDSNLPIIIRINNSYEGGSGTHFVTIVGYKNNIDIKSWNDFKRSIWILDPAYPVGGQIISLPMSEKNYVFYTNGSSQLFWWPSASSAKMPTWCSGQY